MLHGRCFRSITTRPVPHSVEYPRGIYSVEFDRMFAIAKVRETVIAPLKAECLESILLLVAEAYAVEHPEAPTIGSDLLSLLGKSN
jgi:hypothetical protein